MSRRPFGRVTFRVKLLRQMSIHLRSNLRLVNKSLENGKIPNCLKLSNITPVFKPDALTSKNNYTPISVLSAFSKIFERLLSRQLLKFFDNILYKFQCGFRKGYETQHCLLLMLEIRKGATDNNKAFDSSFEGFSKP